jgi:O-antigen ligase
MRLSWRDAAAAVPVAASVGLFLAYRADDDLPLVSGPRVVAVVVFLLGVASCWVGGGIMSSQVPQPRAFWLKALGFHGAAAFLITVLVLITASSAVLAALVALVVLMWLMTTLHRLLVPRDVRRPSDRIGLTGTRS